jgi:hypothetical protein
MDEYLGVVDIKAVDWEGYITAAKTPIDSITP